jgi:multidrug efflux pump subunit AcrB
MPYSGNSCVLPVFAGGGELSLGAMVGFVIFFGIRLRNSNMLISHYEHLVDVEATRGPAAQTVQLVFDDPENETAKRGDCTHPKS